MFRHIVLAGFVILLLHAEVPTAMSQGVPGAKPLEMEGDIASHLVLGADRFLLKQLSASVSNRKRHWNLDGSSPDAYERSLAPNRKHLSKILGLRDPRVPFDSLELSGTLTRPARIASTESYDVYAVRWPAVGGIHGAGLLLEPRTGARANIIAIPDADQLPEEICGLVDGVDPESQFARRFAEHGCRVLVPALINRELKPRNGRAQLTTREYLYRPAFELGRHLIGYELQKIFAGIDWFQKTDPAGPIGTFGWGEGGMLSLYAGALDTRIDVVGVSGYFNSRQNIWNEPIDRNVFGLLEHFGDAELALMVQPRSLVIEAAQGPRVRLPSNGGAPADLKSPEPEQVQKEYKRFEALLDEADLKFVTASAIVFAKSGYGAAALPSFLGLLTTEGGAPSSQQKRIPLRSITPPGTAPTLDGIGTDPVARHERMVREIDQYNQWLLRESSYVRKEYFKNIDTNSVEKYVESIKSYRDTFRHEVIGHYDMDLMPPNPRARKSHDKPAWTGYEVVLDVFPDVFAYGILLLPRDLKPGEKRPVVVCQHGLEGRPQDVVAGDHRAYHDFAAKLAERGFITFAPQNLYIFRDRFRTLQRKSYPLKKTLFSIIVPQHQQIVNWLGSLPFVDKTRIAFYGLSYGGKTAMRVPALVEEYCLSICSADFGEWVWKNASTRSRYSYVWTGEYEMFEFDLGSTFNYAEMAALIAPRPFMVERGHFDSVGPDEMVGYEFAKVRHLYAARLGIGDRCEIEWFTGPHTIHGKGTFEFLHRHLQWDKRELPDVPR